jgi:beta-glucanase (GH16 family)
LTTPSSAAPSPSATVVYAGSNTSIIDAADDIWTISSSDTVLENGANAAFTTNVAEIAYVGATVWHENDFGQWYSWSGWGWDAGNDPLTAQTAPASTPTPTPTPTPRATVVQAGSNAAITDNTGNTWTISSGNTVLENGAPAAFTASVAEIAFIGGTVWHENDVGQWYSWSGWGWNAGTDPLPTQTAAPTPTPPAPAQATTPSANDAVVLAGSADAITDASGNSWTITANGQVAVNGVTDTITGSVIELAFVNGEIWQENSSDLWWGKTNPTGQWSVGTATSPLAVTTNPNPTPAPTPAPASTASPSDTVVLAGSTNAIVDSSGDQWTISASNTVLENGQAAGFTANVAEIAYVNNTLWHENTAGSWYSWGRSGWNPGTDPAGGGSQPTTPTPTPRPPVNTNDGTISINLSAPVTDTGGNNQLLLGYPFGGGSQLTLSSQGEGEVYVSSGVIQNADGSVTLQAQPNPNTGAAWPGNLPYTSGGFSTASLINGEPQPGGFQATYGYFQMTAKLPLGAGLWPAFWLEPTDGTSASASEIDIFEAPFNNPTLIQDSLHDNIGGYTTGQVTVANYATNFNTYGVNWNAQTITYYVNGQVVGSTPTPASANTAHYILANLAVGGQSWSWPGTTNASNTWPADMTIQNITYNPNGPGGVGNDGGTYSGGLAMTPSSTPSATSATVAQSQISAAATTAATMQLTNSAAAGVSSSAGGQTYVIPAAGNGVEAFTSNILAAGDTLNLTMALAATDWNGSSSTLPNYLTVADSAQAATLSISATSGGPGIAIATIDGATTATLSSLLAHAIT